MTSGGEIIDVDWRLIIDGAFDAGRMIIEGAGTLGPTTDGDGGGVPGLVGAAETLTGFLNAGGGAPLRRGFLPPRALPRGVVLEKPPP